MGEQYYNSQKGSNCPSILEPSPKIVPNATLLRHRHYRPVPLKPRQTAHSSDLGSHDHVTPYVNTLDVNYFFQDVMFTRCVLLISQDLMLKLHIPQNEAVKTMGEKGKGQNEGA